MLDQNLDSLEIEVSVKQVKPHLKLPQHEKGLSDGDDCHLLWRLRLEVPQHILSRPKH